jgi:hypothetical protein
MSKQAEAREAQGYRTEPRNCSNCAHYRSDITEHPPAFSWGNPYTTESNRRCSLGSFAVKKTATCDRWAAGEPQTKEAV